MRSCHNKVSFINVTTLCDTAIPTLMAEITHHCQNIDARTLENIFENKKRRVALCLQQNDDHFQHLL
jgi:hypothetical protein